MLLISAVTPIGMTMMMMMIITINEMTQSALIINYKIFSESYYFVSHLLLLIAVQAVWAEESIEQRILFNANKCNSLMFKDVDRHLKIPDSTYLYMYYC